MKQKDHKALAKFLLDCAGDRQVLKKTWHRRFFLCGCLSPDYLPLTYFCGFQRHHTMRGHHARYSQKKIGKSIQRLQKRGVHRLRDCFRLGTLMHYLSDSFTYSHTDEFCGDMRAHRDYENRLHPYFSSALLQTVPLLCQSASRAEPFDEWLLQKRCEYAADDCNLLRDCTYILQACTELFCGLCAEASADRADFI